MRHPLENEFYGRRMRLSESEWAKQVFVCWFVVVNELWELMEYESDRQVIDV